MQCRNFRQHGGTCPYGETCLYGNFLAKEQVEFERRSLPENTLVMMKSKQLSLEMNPENYSLMFGKWRSALSLISIVRVRMKNLKYEPSEAFLDFLEMFS